MKRWKFVLVVTIIATALIALTTSVLAAMPSDELVAICEDLYGDVFGVPNSEPLGACQ